MAAAPVSPTVLAPRYQTRFACIGGACEATCCAGWSISIDEPHYRKMRGTLGQTKAGRALFDASVKKVKGRDATRAKHALIVLNPATKRCNLLDAQSMCSLQGGYGEHLLPDVCATYPRSQSLIRSPEGDRAETALTLSCPEAARLALLATDAMELVDVDESVIPREHWMQLSEGNHIYEAALDVVRSALLRIISSAPTLAGGLATAAALADALGDSFARNAAAPISSQLLLETVEAYSNPLAVKTMASELDKIAVPLTVPMKPLLEILAARVELPEGEFGLLLRHATLAYGVSANTIVADVAQAYAKHRDAVASRVEQRLNEMLTNYVLDHVFAHWYTNASNLGVYVRGTILRVAFLRFLVFAHPDIRALAEKNEQDEQGAQATVERVLVEIVFKLTRDIDHHGPFLAMLDRVLPAAMPGLEHALTLLKL